MSAYTMDLVWQPIDEAYRAEMMAHTWGHLAAKKGKIYRGWILFAIPAYDSGSPCIIQAEFKGLDDSPWFYDAMMDFIDQSDAVPCEEFSRCRTEESTGVYRFEGSIRNYEFTGTVTKLKMPDSETA